MKRKRIIAPCSRYKSLLQYFTMIAERNSELKTLMQHKKRIRKIKRAVKEGSYFVPATIIAEKIINKIRKKKK